MTSPRRRNLPQGHFLNRRRPFVFAVLLLLTGACGSETLWASPVGSNTDPAQTPVSAEGNGAKKAYSFPPDMGVTDIPDSAPIIGKLGHTTTVEADTLLDIAYRHELGFIELAAANPDVDPWLPGDGTDVILPTQHILPDAPHKGIVINLAEMRLYHFPADGGAMESYPVGIGRGGLSTPTGTTKISARMKDPNWYPTRRMRKEDPSLPRVVEPGPENPLGEYALNLEWPSYLIHGTNNKWGIGRRVSSGCIRLYPDHVKNLFNTVATGTSVTVVDQPIKFAWIGADLYVEAHTTQAQAEELEQTGTFSPDKTVDLEALAAKARGGRNVAIDRERLEQAVANRRGIPVRISRQGET